MITIFLEQSFYHLKGIALPILGGLLIYWIIQRILKVLVKGTALSCLAMRPMALIARYTIIAGVAFMIFAHFEIPTDGFWTILTTAVATFAVAFVASWSLLCNLLCTLLIIILKTFSIGDEIELPPDEIRGKVIDLTLFFTILRDVDGSLIQIPNSQFFQRIIKRRPAANIEN